ncbi:unnamed protein product [Effrenium voratum]|nr:unnamed protein product [Effrenium voratum]
MKLQVKAGFEERRIWVGGLPVKISESDIKRKFRDFGEIEFVSLKHKEQDSFCFIGFDTAKAAEDAIRRMDRSDDWGNPIKVTLSLPPKREGSHRSVEYADWKDEARRSTSRERNSHREKGQGYRPERPRSPGNENSRALLDRAPKVQESESEYSDRDSSYYSEGEDAAKVQSKGVLKPRELRKEQESGSSSSSEERGRLETSGRREEAKPRAETEGEAPAAGGDRPERRRRRRKVDANGQPERRMKRRRRQPSAKEAPVPEPEPREKARSRSPRSPPRTTKPPLQRKRPARESGICVRVENLPSDMSLDELKNTAFDFGEVIQVKLEKTKDKSKTGHITFEDGTDVELVLKKLDNRRVEGWDRRLRCVVESR